MSEERPPHAGGLFLFDKWMSVCRNVRFGSKADICAATSHVRFAPNSDRESEFPQRAMSALPPRADMCGAPRDVCYGPKADIDGLRGPLVERFGLRQELS